MDRAAYNDCMRPYITGQHEDRKLDFCIGAKICSGKADSKEAAAKICRETPPKPPKTPKARRAGKHCDVESIEKLTTCIISDLPPLLPSESLTTFRIRESFKESLSKCLCGSTKKIRKGAVERGLEMLTLDQQQALLAFMESRKEE